MYTYAVILMAKYDISTPAQRKLKNKNNNNIHLQIINFLFLLFFSLLWII